MNFQHEPLTDFSKPEHRAAFQRELANARAHLGQKIPLLIGAERIFPERTLARENPSHPCEIVGQVGLADPSHAQAAIRHALRAFPAWAGTPLAKRAQIFRRAAELTRSRRLELAALEVVEVGKSWVEADADVAEAIDFMTYYPNELSRWEAQTAIGQVPGEENQYRREPLGPGAVIAPWNFPLAILAGMSTAALVCGNPALLKPAEQASALAWRLVQIFLEAGVPAGIVQFLPGLGEEVGVHLVRSPHLHWIAFTGSKRVGLEILRRAAEMPPGQFHIKRVIAEMGGKNAIVIDQDADLDEATLGVLASAFGFSGQKCSACSRVIVVGPILEPFLERMKEAVCSLPIGPAEEPGTVIGPLVDKEAQQRVLRAIETGKREGTAALEVSPPAGLEGYFVGPVIFTGLAPKSVTAQEEIFGPVLAVLPADSFEQALAIANAVPYALTGGVYSRSPAHIDQAKEAFQVGNLYINRKITGAIVGLQPFGGLKLSGSGYKAGGPDYLLQFMKSRTITENITRHGFAPPTSGPAPPATP